jgi:hypothetical protein
MRRIRTVITLAATPRPPRAITLGARLAVPLAALLVLVSGAACSGKTDHAGAAGSGEAKPASPAPAKCPPGNVVKDGACVAVVTPENIAAVARQQSRLDDLARLLDQVDTVGAPIEVFNGMRQLEQWKALARTSDKFAAVDAIAGALDNAVKTLRTFKASLAEASARLGNLKTELDRLMTDPGTARRFEEVRAQVSTALRAALEPLAAQIQDTIHNAIVPLTTELSRVGNLVITGCTMAELSGGGDKMKEMCAQAQDGFAKARAYVDELKGKPAQLFADVTGQLETQLGLLVDAETRTLIDAAQLKVNEALKLPPAATGSAGSAGSGSGSSH